MVNSIKDGIRKAFLSNDLKVSEDYNTKFGDLYITFDPWYTWCFSSKVMNQAFKIKKLESRRKFLESSAKKLSKERTKKLGWDGFVFIEYPSSGEDFELGLTIFYSKEGWKGD